MSAFSDTLQARTQRLDVYRAMLDGRSGPGTVTIYAGTVPADADQAPTGERLAVLTLGLPCATAIDGELVFAPIAECPQAEASGEPTFARFADAAGTAVFDVSVGGPGSGAAIELNQDRIATGGPVRIAAFRLEDQA